MKTNIVALLLFVIANHLNCFGSLSRGAAGAGMGNINLAMPGFWHAINNVSSLANLHRPEIGFFYENRFMLKELGKQGMALAIPSKLAVFGFQFDSFGFANYRQYNAKFGIAKKLFKNVDAGVAINYNNLSLEDFYGRKSGLIIEIGFQFKINDQVTSGIHVANPMQLSLSEFDKWPTVYRLGLSYKLFDRAVIATEIEKDSGNRPNLKIGFEYFPVDRLCIRSGINTSPASNSFGFGIVMDKFIIDFASNYHFILGYSPSISVVLPLAKEK